MADDIANILIRLGADTSEGDKKLDEFRRGLREFGKIKETATAGIEVKGEANLKATIVALNGFARIRATATAEVEVRESGLDKAIQRLKDFGEAQKQVPSSVVGGQASRVADRIPAAAGQGIIRQDAGGPIDQLKAKLDDFFNKGRRGFDDLRNKSSLLDKSADILGHSLSDAVTKFGPDLAKASTGLGKLLDSIGGQSGVIGGPTSALGKVFTNLATEGPKGIAAIIPVAAVAAAAINALLATVVALAASLAAAAGGVVALGVAFAAALGPAVLVAVGVFKQLSDIIQVVSTQRKDQASQQDALTKATLQQQAAQNQLAKATTGGNQAAVNAIQQQKDAVLALANAYLGLQSAKLGITDAALALEQANLALKSFKSTIPGGLSLGQLTQKAQGISVTGGGPQDAGVAGGKDAAAAAELQFDQLQQNKAHALLGVKEAAQHVADATNNYAKAQVAVTQGLGNTTGASNAATAAASRLEKANIAVQRAQLAVNKASGTGSALSSLSAEGRKLVPTFKLLADTVKKTFGGAIDAVLASIGKAAKTIIPVIQALRGPFTELGKIMGGAIERIAKALSTPAMIKTFKGFIADSGKLITIITPGFIAFLQILIEIAKDAMPALLELFKALTGVLVNVAKHPESIAKAVKIAIDSFFAWGKLIGAVVVALGKLIGIAAPLGNGLLAVITKLVEKFSAFLSTKAGRDSVTKWLKDGIAAFQNMVSIIGSVLHVLAPVLALLIRIGGFLFQLAPLIKVVAGIINIVLKAIFTPVNLLLDAFKFLGVLIGKVAFFVYDKLGPAFKIWFDVVTAPLKLIWDVFKAIYDTIVSIIDAIGRIKLPNLTGSVSIPGIGNINPLHAEGGIATRATQGIFGEAGPEGIIPLTDRVFAQLGAAIALNIPQHRLTGTPTGKTVNQTNHIAVNAPAGHSPDINHFMAGIENKLDALGAPA